MLCPISTIASESAAPTEDTSKYTVQLLDCIASQEEATLPYTVSNTKLVVHSDASYLSETKKQEQSRRILLPIMRNSGTRKSWLGAQTSTHQHARHVISYGCNIDSTLYHGQGGSV